MTRTVPCGRSALRARPFALFVLSTLLLFAMSRSAAAQGAVSGVVFDPLGARVPGATVTLHGSAQPAPETRSGADGAFEFTAVPAGTYDIVVTASGFGVATSDPVYVGNGGRASVDVTVPIGPVAQSVVVTAAAAETPQAQTGAPVTVLDSRTIDALNKPDVLEALRLVPGAQTVQSGGRGAATSVFIRGGNPAFNKVLVDGVAVNDIGGAFDFAQMATAGVERIEVLRQTNSVMYGSDALAGVIAITTRRGRTRVPAVTYSADGGNLGTFSTAAGVGGVVRRFDYFSEYSRFQTDNELPNNEYRNGTYAGRFGIVLRPGTEVSGTIRRTDTDYESPNAFRLFGIADDSSQSNELTYASIALRTQLDDRWQAEARFGSTDQSLHAVNPAPTGEPFDPFGFGANFLGDRVMLRGANGYETTGRAILDFGGSYPSVYDSRSTRRALSGETTYQVAASLAISGGVRYEREAAFSAREEDPSATRTNGGGFVEGRWNAATRLFVTAGVGVEHNEAFGNAATPRVSAAWYLRQPTANGFGDTKIVVNAGTGIKAPSVSQEQSSLSALVQGTPAGAAVEAIGPERSRSFDVGVEQGFAGGRARIRVSYFHNRFSDLIEFLERTQLVGAGVPADVAAATAFGAYINSQSYRTHGIETSLDAAPVRGLRLTASYTHLAAEVTDAFSAVASINPAFPGVPIGAYSPLVGERPFRRAPHSGTAMVAYAPGRAEVALAASFVGTRDDSTFLSDAFFGNSMLLPNRDLDAGYQKVDVSGAYQVHRRVRGYITIENLLNRDYEPTFGYPALPTTARFGLKVNIGG